MERLTRKRRACSSRQLSFSLAGRPASLPVARRVPRAGAMSCELARCPAISGYAPRSRAAFRGLAPRRCPVATVGGPASIVAADRISRPPLARRVRQSRAASSALAPRPPISRPFPPTSRKVAGANAVVVPSRATSSALARRRPISRDILRSRATSGDLRPRRCEPFPSSLDPRRRRARHARRPPIFRVVVSRRPASRELAPRRPTSRHVPQARVPPSALAPRPAPWCAPLRLRAASPTRAHRRSLRQLPRRQPRPLSGGAVCGVEGQLVGSDPTQRRGVAPSPTSAVSASFTYALSWGASSRKRR